ncbi:MAG: hypothetical protein ABI434_06295 [Burkholderiaceae bacterium]
MRANTLVQDHPEQAHAVIASIGGAGHVVSVRAQRTRPGGAAELCMAFPTGGGRSGAAGIDHLPDDKGTISCGRLRKPLPTVGVAHRDHIAGMGRG